MRNVEQIVLAVCDYLDPAGWYPRPAVDLLPLEYMQIADGQYSHTRHTVFYCLGLSDDRLLHVLAHEVRHWWQYHVGWLETPSNEFWWRGERWTTDDEIRKLIFSGDSNYNRLPWERDAEDFANEYMGHVAKTLAA